jgi:hypothetical protein
MHYVRVMLYNTIVPNGTIILHINTLMPLWRTPFYITIHCVRLRKMYSFFLCERNGGKSKEEKTWICGLKRMSNDCWHSIHSCISTSISFFCLLLSLPSLRIISYSQSFFVSRVKEDTWHHLLCYNCLGWNRRCACLKRNSHYLELSFYLPILVH